MPLVSVIIPTHNRPNLLERAIQSVRNQTFKDYEIIVVDDTWSTLPLYNDYPDVHFLHIPETPYPGIARNAGIKASRGKYIAFLDDDDIWYPEKLEHQVDILERCPNIGSVCSNGITNNKQYYINKFIETEFNNTMLKEEIMGDFVVTSSCVIRKDLLEKTGLYNELPLCEDYDLSLRFAAVSGIYYSQLPLFEYTISENSIQNRAKKSYTLYHKCIIKALKNLKVFLKNNNKNNSYISLIINYRIITEYIIVIWNVIKDKIRGIK